jgi:Carboxypeptidase regulatory-like domain/TonB-dependent Receptor Plug Domain
MARRVLSLAVALTLGLGLASTARAQGVQTGVLTGTVTTADGATLPGANVTVQSPALQGVQSAVTDVNGVYIVRGLPPGQYTVTFEMSGMTPLKKEAAVALGRTVTVDATLQLSGVSEMVTVQAETAPVVNNPTAGANYTQKLINDLPVGRTPFLVAELAPGLTDTGPNAGQINIGGAFAYDNVFLMNGVDINDNLFGTNNNLFIEDAVEETQILTSGISAEYGRFSGGVINIVTKRGGDSFSGSYRQNVRNLSWTDETPFETRARPDTYVNAYEGTFGGPIVRQKVWFFTAGRYADTSSANTFSQTGIPYTQQQENRRYELKGTGTIVQNHTIQGSWMDNNTKDTNRPGLAVSIDPRTLDSRELPNDLFVVNYNGVLSPKMFATFQVSQKRFGFRGSGGGATDIHDSPFFSVGVAGVPGGRAYNAPYFDETDPEDRNNRQVAGSLSYFVGTPRFGSHDVKGGFEWFRATNTGGNSQTPTGFVFDADYVAAGGTPVFDSQGRLIPIFQPGVTQLEQWLPTRGARIDIDTTSLYVHDRFTAGKRWTFDAGLRYERVRSEATGDIQSVNTDTVVPRLAATFDATGDGKVVLQTTYGHYAGKYSENQFANNTNVGNPSNVVFDYVGPPGRGLEFAPGFDLANYDGPVSGTFPTANVFFEDGLHSPLTREFTASVGSQLTPRVYAKGTYIWRKLTGAIDDFIDTTTGQTTVIRDGVDFGTFDNAVYRNTDIAKRDYQALLFQGQYRVRNDLTVQGHWTVQLQNEGNFEGEAPNQPGAPSLLADYPEVFTEARNFPLGRTDDFQRHKVRLWAVYNMSIGRFGGLDLSALYRFNSGVAYSLFAEGVPLTDTQLALAHAAGYANEPGGGVQDLYFGERGSELFPDYSLFDIGVQYNVPVWWTVRPYAKLDILNLFNNQDEIGFDTTVTPDFDGPVDALGLPLDFIRGSRFGQPVANNDFPVWRPGFDGGRTFLLAFGVRF